MMKDADLKELLDRVENTALLPYINELQKTSQTDTWHAEGDVYTHTMMVYEALKALPEYHALPWRSQAELRISALLHDLGKPQTTKFYNGDWHSPYHGPVGSEMVYKLLRDDYGMRDEEGLQNVRDTICLLVRYHDFPLRSVIKKNAATMLLTIAESGRTSPDFSIKMLCILSKADIMGRICDHKGNALYRIALWEQLALEKGCYEGQPAR